MTQKTHILIVDDQEPFAVNLSRILKSRGFDVTVALDGFQAVDAVGARTGIDVVILDDKMPGLDGLTTLSKIKKIAPDIQVILLTAHATLDSGARMVQNGAFDYLMKPCDTEYLVEKIREALEVRQTEKNAAGWRRHVVEELCLFAFHKLFTEDPVARAVEVFERYRGKTVIEELYVQDRRGKLRGAVSKQDLIDVLEKEGLCAYAATTWNDIAENPHWLPQKPLQAVMRSTPMVTTTPEETLVHVARRMISAKVTCIPVLQEGKMMGIIRLQDILQHIRKACLLLKQPDSAP